MQTGSMLLTGQNLLKQFKGLWRYPASTSGSRGGDRRPDRAQWGGQEHDVQPAFRLSGPLRAGLEIAGADMSKAKPERISRQGLVRTFQHGGYLPSMSVRDNVLIGLPGRPAHRPRGRKRQEQVIAQAIALFGLAGNENDIARNLPHGLAAPW